MELIKELPAVFEDFAEARRNAFVNVKKVKDQGIPVIGSYCTYFPQELAIAAGAATVGLCSTSGETIAAAEKDLPANLCPLIKSSYGFAKEDKCPFFYFSDIVVGENTCDGKKKMYELMSDFKDVFIMDLPNSQSDKGLELYKEELLRMKDYVKITVSTSREPCNLIPHQITAITIVIIHIYRLQLRSCQCCHYSERCSELHEIGNIFTHVKGCEIKIISSAVFAFTLIRLNRRTTIWTISHPLPPYNKFH